MNEPRKSIKKSSLAEIDFHILSKHMSKKDALRILLLANALHQESQKRIREQETASVS